MLVSPSGDESATRASSSGVPSGFTTKISTSSGEDVSAASARAARRTRENGGGSRSSGLSVVLPSLSVIFSVAWRTPGGTTIGRRTVPFSAAATGPTIWPATVASTLEPGLVSITIVSEPESGMETQ